MHEALYKLRGGAAGCRHGPGAALATGGAGAAMSRTHGKENKGGPCLCCVARRRRGLPPVVAVLVAAPPPCPLTRLTCSNLRPRDSLAAPRHRLSPHPIASRPDDGRVVRVDLRRARFLAKPRGWLIIGRFAGLLRHTSRLDSQPRRTGSAKTTKGRGATAAAGRPPRFEGAGQGHDQGWWRQGR